MSLHPRTTQLTAMDALRALLGDYAEGDRDFEGRLLHALQDLRHEALREVRERLLRPAVPRGLKRTLLQVAARIEAPEWAPLLLAFLQTETDLGLFDEGCAALGVLATREAAAALRHLKATRTDPDRQLIVNRELNLGTSPQDETFHLARLQEGRGNPRLARQAARVLAWREAPLDPGLLAEAYLRGDDLTRQLALRQLAEHPATEAGDLLVRLFRTALEEFEQGRLLDGLLDRTRSQPRSLVRDDLLRELERRQGGRHPAEAAELRRRVELEPPEPGPALEALRPFCTGPLDAFLLEALGCLLEGKVARYGALHSEAAERTEHRQAELSALVDGCAEALARRVAAGLGPARPQAVEMLGTAFQAHCGGDAALTALVRLVTPEDGPVLDLFLVDQDLRRRTRCLDAVGAREEDAFAPFFMRAMDDPIVEVGHAAMHHLGKLPSGFHRLMDLLRSGHPDEMRRAIRVFGENRTRAAAEAMLEPVLEEARDELVLEAVTALGTIVYIPAAGVFLGLLHDGKPLNLQLALAEALAGMAVPQASLGLLDRAAHLKAPQVLVVALEGALKAFPDFSRPFPTERLPDFEALLQRCCDDREGEGQRLRALFSTQGLFTFQRGVYDRLRDRFTDFLSEMRGASTWDRELNDRVAGVIKELTRRADNLSRLEEREAALLGMMAGLPAAPGPRVEALLHLRDGLRDPELLLRPAAVERLAAFVAAELVKPGKDWRELAHLCEIGACTQRAEVVEPVRGVLRRATGIGLRAAARESLSRLGLSEADMDRRGPIHSILLLEPSAFFRKRLAAALEERRYKVAQAGDRTEAAAILAGGPVDLLVSEAVDPAGATLAWLEEQWRQRRCQEVMLATSHRDLVPAAEAATWLMGVLHKPFPVEHLAQAIEA